MFYVYRQNNSGGFFIGPALNVIVEADDAEQANERALELIYFDGEGDCDCCGNRWYGAWSDDGYATEEEAREACSPSIFRPGDVPPVRVLRELREVQ